MAVLQLMLTFAFFGEVISHSGFCVDKQCFSVREEQVDFQAARKACEELKGHLLTVRTKESQSAIPTLLSTVGDFWIGLRYDGSCPKTVTELKGYKWITGDEEAEFHDWTNDDLTCPASPQCVTVSSETFKWQGKSCNEKVAGFICEFANDASCPQLPSDLHASVVTYTTLYGFEGRDLQVLPFGSVATLRNGEKYICIENWTKSPWNCEVLDGGCEHKCTGNQGKYVCTCPPGSIINSNGRTCSQSAPDPCAQSECAFACIIEKDSFICICNDGFSLGPDGKSCFDIDDCIDDTFCADEHAKCQNTVGSFKCVCDAGFKMEKGICVDINECSSGPCEHDCVNTVGSYYCNCGMGYKVSEEDPHRCKSHCPQQECPAVCDPNDKYQCYCPDGFVKDLRNNGTFCVDIDECEMDFCDQFCENSFGSYTCSCGEEYTLLNGFECEPIDGLISTTTYVPATPTITFTSVMPQTVTAGGLLGIVVCIVCVLLALVLLAHHVMKRRKEISLIGARKNSDTHDLEQITTEQYKSNFSEQHVKGER